MRKLIIKSILAGMSIAFGAIAYVLTFDQGIVGPALFSIGILLVIEFDFKLFTSYVPKYAPLGKEDHRLNANLHYLRNCLIVVAANFIGAASVAVIVYHTRISDGTFASTIEYIAHHKVEDGLLSVFIMSVFCGLIIACICKAEKWKNNVLYIVILISVFIICGFDHVVANSFYLVYSGELWSVTGLIYILINLLGNFIGGYLFVFTPLLGVDEPPHYYEDKMKKKKELEEKEKALEQTNR
ncbi:MAG: formate/nitrite transporter family protein [bacterium]